MNKDGMTLLEVVVALAVISILSVVIMGSLMSISRMNNRTRIKDSLTEHMYSISEEISSLELVDKGTLHDVVTMPKGMIDYTYLHSFIYSSREGKEFYAKEMDNIDYLLIIGENDLFPEEQGLVKIVLSSGGVSYDSSVWVSLKR